MADRNTLIVDRSPLHAADPTNFESRSPPMQKSHDIQEIYEEETHRIYHFQNCGAVYINSCNAHGVRMENCSNNVPQVTTYHSPRITNNEKDLQTLYHALSNGSPNASGLPTVSNETSKSNLSTVHRQENVLSPLQSPQPLKSTSRSPFYHDISISSAKTMPHQQSGGMLHTVPAARRMSPSSSTSVEDVLLVYPPSRVCIQGQKYFGKPHIVILLVQQTHWKHQKFLGTGLPRKTCVNEFLTS